MTIDFQPGQQIRWATREGVALRTGYRWLAWWAFFLLAAISAIGMLIGPRTPSDKQAEYCVANIRFAGPFGLSLNCDSPEFLSLAEHPGGLLAEKSVRQSRPGQILVATVLRKALDELRILPDAISFERLPYEGPPRRDSLRARPYLAYLLLNIALLAAVFWLFLQFAESGLADASTAISVAAVGSLLAVNDITKAFFWSPHSQLFNIVVPLFAVMATLQAARGAHMQWRWVLRTGAIVGFGMLAYPLFTIVVPCVFLAAAVHLVSSRTGVTMQSLARGAVFVLASVIPYSAWYFFVRLTTGQFYSAEVALYRQGLWMLDAWHDGDLLPRWWSYFSSLSQMAAGHLAPIAIMAGLTALLILVRRIELRQAGPLAVSALLVSLMTLCFYACVGFSAWRIGYTAIPPLIIVIGNMAAFGLQKIPAAQRKYWAGAYSAMAIANLVYAVIKDGPYS